MIFSYQNQRKQQITATVECYGIMMTKEFQSYILVGVRRGNSSSWGAKSAGIPSH